ncbi:unnamed protein product [Clavelina lepadiformis]|uniref:Uncharacterized protein n=1 Tax=Clavelina lepadiformis TaxID=159417 RepID=A0ABP0FFQ8_CLALP
MAVEEATRHFLHTDAPLHTKRHSRQIHRKSSITSPHRVTPHNFDVELSSKLSSSIKRSDEWPSTENPVPIYQPVEKIDEADHGLGTTTAGSSI